MTNWRSSGDTTEEAFRALLPIQSEIVKRDEVSKVYRAGRPYTRLLAGMLAAESSYATHFNRVPASMNNPLNLKKRHENVFLSFPTIAASVADWKNRITSPTYAYKDTETVRDLVAIYAPGYDHNDENAYVRAVEGVMRSLPILEEKMTLPKAPPLEIAITPHGPNRPALEMPSPSYITVHEVGNTKPGADEDMHRVFVHNGGGPAQVSFHFVVGPTKAIQLIPLDEAAWHASDGYNGTGNRDSIAIETIQIGDFDKTMWNLAWLINEIATSPDQFFHNKNRKWDLSIQRIVQHNHWAPDNKNCPQFIRDRGLWPELMRRVDLWHVGNQPSYAVADKPQWLTEDNGRRVEYINQTPVYPLGLTYTAINQTRRRQGAEPNTNDIGPVIEPGLRFKAGRVFRSRDKTYVLTPAGSRILAEDLVPRVEVSVDGRISVKF